VIVADTAYARKLGINRKQPATGDIAAIGELREAIAAVVGTPSDGSPVLPSGWTTRYAARRIAWHVLEHAWEMQDRAESSAVQSHRQAPCQQVWNMSLHKSVCKESPDQCGQGDRWDVVPILDRGSFQSEQHITDHAANEPGDDSSGEHRQ
jgi:hypothetical protein